MKQTRSEKQIIEEPKESSGLGYSMSNDPVDEMYNNIAEFEERMGAL
jgi:hypothetical protein